VTLQLLQAEKMALQRGVAELESELPLHDITAEDKFRTNLDVWPALSCGYPQYLLY
jgi:hypothetical protein